MRGRHPALLASLASSLLANPHCPLLLTGQLESHHSRREAAWPLHLRWLRGCRRRGLSLQNGTNPRSPGPISLSAIYWKLEVKRWVLRSVHSLSPEGEPLLPSRAPWLAAHSYTSTGASPTEGPNSLWPWAWTPEYYFPIGELGPAGASGACSGRNSRTMKLGTESPLTQQAKHGRHWLKWKHTHTHPTSEFSFSSLSQLDGCNDWTEACIWPSGCWAVSSWMTLGPPALHRTTAWLQLVPHSRELSQTWFACPNTALSKLSNILRQMSSPYSFLPELDSSHLFLYYIERNLQFNYQTVEIKKFYLGLFSF